MRLRIRHLVHALAEDVNAAAFRSIRSDPKVATYRIDSEKTVDRLLLGVAPRSLDIAMQGRQPRGQAELVCTFEIDANGLLKVSALDKTSGCRANITITNSVGRLSSSEIDQMINDAQRFSAQDKEFTARQSQARTGVSHRFGRVYECV